MHLPTPAWSWRCPPTPRSPGRGEHGHGDAAGGGGGAWRAGGPGGGGGGGVDDHLVAGVGVIDRHRVGDDGAGAGGEVPGPGQDRGGVAHRSGGGGGVGVVGGVVQRRARESVNITPIRVSARCRSP